MDCTVLRKNLEMHGFIVHVFPSRVQAREFLQTELTGRTIGFGGSVTLRDMGLYEALSEKNEVVWHNRTPGLAVRRLAANTEVYLTSANAISAAGEIVNIDGTGNRVAMTAFGPTECYYVIGRNKIAPDLAAALHRARNIAAPQNARRVGAKTPCAVKMDKCYDCNSPDRICRATLIVDRPPFGMKCVVLLIDEDLGM